MRFDRTCKWFALVLAATPLAFFGADAPSKEPSTALELARQLNQAFIEVADQVSPAVVVIRVAHQPNFPGSEADEENPFWDFVPREFRKQLEEQQRQRHDTRERPSRRPVFDGQGSGVVVREEGYILTNRHVVDEAEKISVRFKDDSMWYDAEIRGVDAQSDLAVILRRGSRPQAWQLPARSNCGRSDGRVVAGWRALNRE